MKSYYIHGDRVFSHEELLYSWRESIIHMESYYIILYTQRSYYIQYDAVTDVLWSVAPQNNQSLQIQMFEFLQPSGFNQQRTECKGDAVAITVKMTVVHHAAY